MNGSGHTACACCSSRPPPPPPPSVASCRPVHLVASWHTAGHRCCICIRVSPDDSSYSWDISRVVQQGLQLGACVPVRPAPPPPHTLARWGSQGVGSTVPTDFGTPIINRQCTGSGESCIHLLVSRQVRWPPSAWQAPRQPTVAMQANKFDILPSSPGRWNSAHKAVFAEFEFSQGRHVGPAARQCPIQLIPCQGQPP